MANPNGGPRTEQGKTVSSRNAIKIGLYTNTLLDGEDPQELEATRQALLQSWGVTGTQAELLARDYLYAEIRTARLLRAQRAHVQTLMHTYDTRREFAKQAGISPLEQDKLPNWYFSDDQANKDKAVQLAFAVDEAANLKKNYSLPANLQAKRLFPNLWTVVMGPNAIQPVQTLGERLITLYSKGSPQANLQAFIDENLSEHRYEILWGCNSERYEAILEGLNAQHELDVMSRPDWLKVEAQQNRRRNEVLHAVLSLKRDAALLVQVTQPGQALPRLEDKDRAGEDLEVISELSLIHI